MAAGGEDLDAMMNEAAELEQIDPASANLKLTRALIKEVQEMRKLQTVNQTAHQASLAALQDKVSQLETKTTAVYDGIHARLNDIEVRLNKIEQSKIEWMDQVSQRETYSRSWSFRIAPPPNTVEIQTENCAQIVTGMLKPHIPDFGEISIAHRTGRHQAAPPAAASGIPGQPAATKLERMILVQMVKKADCRNVLHQRRKLWDLGIKVYEDLSPLDREKKKLVSQLMKEKYEENRKPVFRNGQLYVSGRLHPFDYTAAYKKVFPNCF